MPTPRNISPPRPPRTTRHRAGANQDEPGRASPAYAGLIIRRSDLPHLAAMVRACRHLRCPECDRIQHAVANRLLAIDAAETTTPPPGKTTPGRRGTGAKAAPGTAVRGSRPAGGTNARKQEAH